MGGVKQELSVCTIEGVVFVEYPTECCRADSDAAKTEHSRAASCDAESTGVVLLSAGITVVDATPLACPLDFVHTSQETSQPRIASGYDRQQGIVWVYLQYYTVLLWYWSRQN